MREDRKIVITLVEEHRVMGRHEFAIRGANDRRSGVLSDQSPDDSKVGSCVMDVVAHQPIVGICAAGREPVADEPAGFRV